MPPCHHPCPPICLPSSACSVPGAGPAGAVPPGRLCVFEGRAGAGARLCGAPHLCGLRSLGTWECVCVWGGGDGHRHVSWEGAGCRGGHLPGGVCGVHRRAAAPAACSRCAANRLAWRGLPPPPPCSPSDDQASLWVLVGCRAPVWLPPAVVPGALRPSGCAWAGRHLPLGSHVPVRCAPLPRPLLPATPASEPGPCAFSSTRCCRCCTSLCMPCVQAATRPQGCGSEQPPLICPPPHPPTLLTPAGASAWGSMALFASTPAAMLALLMLGSASTACADVVADSVVVELVRKPSANRVSRRLGQLQRRGLRAWRGGGQQGARAAVAPCRVATACTSSLCQPADPPSSKRVPAGHGWLAAEPVLGLAVDGRHRVRLLQVCAWGSGSGGQGTVSGVCRHSSGDVTRVCVCVCVCVCVPWLAGLVGRQRVRAWTRGSAGGAHLLALFNHFRRGHEG